MNEKIDSKFVCFDGVPLTSSQPYPHLSIKICSRLGLRSAICFPLESIFCHPEQNLCVGPFHFFMTINEEQFVNYCGSSMTRLRRHLSVYGTNDCGFLQSKIISTKFRFYVENKGKSIKLLSLVLLRR